MNVDVQCRMPRAYETHSAGANASPAAAASTCSQRGFSMIELTIVVTVAIIITAIAIPTLRSTARYKVRNDARAIVGQLMVARMRAGSDFSRVQLTCTPSKKTCVMGVRQNGDAAFSNEGTVVTLSSGVSFAIPSAASGGAGNQSTPVQGSKNVTPATGTIQITFNSRGLPVDPSSPTSVVIPDYAIYLNDTDNRSYAVAVDAGGRPILYKLNGSSYSKFKD